MLRWPIAAAACVAAAGCSDIRGRDATTEHRLAAQAGLASSPQVAAVRQVAVDAPALAGNRRDPAAMQKHPSLAPRLIDREAFRPSARTSRKNLLKLVVASQKRNMASIDRSGTVPALLGDTLTAVVNLQAISANISAVADTFSRNGQLGQGMRAMLQPKRRMDVLQPETPRAIRAQQGASK